MKKIVLALAAVMGLAACSAGTPSADSQQREATAEITAQAQAEVGMPGITNFYERRLLKEIYERRDQADLGTYAYFQSLDGTLTCLGRAIGYGVPYSTQFSNPMRSRGRWANMPQAEPNGLFTPDGMSATWLQLVAPDGEVHVVYVEPSIVVSPFPLSGPSVKNAC